MKIHFDTLQFSRTRIAELIENLTYEQLNKIPNENNFQFPERLKD